MYRVPTKLFSRRDFFSKLTGLLAASIPIALIASGCSDKKSDDTRHENTEAEITDCKDLSGVSKEDLAIREKLAYVNESPIPESQCANCNLYLPPSNGKKCGGCMLFKGPVEANGYCTYWAPKV